jgi:MFS transporter, PAT family, beta-lactamase induction signal transducer AmpG
MWQKIFSRKMLSIFLTGYAGGLPLLLVGSTLQAWMTEAGIDLGTIGLFASVGTPYSLKVLWAPLMDRFHFWPGRRRGWMLLMQILLVISIFSMSLFEPAANIYGIAVMALLVAIFSATQDISIDAYRREILSDEELGMGSSLYVVGYRVGLLIAGAGALWMADRYLLPTGQANWPLVYQVMAGAMALGIVFTAFAYKESEAFESPQSLQEAVVGPFLEFFKRDGAILVLVFIVLYKLGDTMAANMTTPFMLLKGYTKTDIATVVKGFGLMALILGGILGGIGTLKMGITRSLWVFGILQGVSTAGFCWLSIVETNITNLTLVIAFENLSAGLGSSAYAAFMASMTNRKYTGTQYALLTALMALPRTFLSAPTGYMAEAMGWNGFFLFCTLIAIPGMAVIPFLTRKSPADRSPVP